MLKKELKEFLKIYNEQTVPKLRREGFVETPITAREALRDLTSRYTNRVVKVEKIINTVLDYSLEYDVSLRIFNPDPLKKLPVLIYYHGGGGMVGSVSVYDPIYRRLATKTNHIVVAPEYRLAPENKYPKGLIDSINTVKYIKDKLRNLNIKFSDEISIAGDSAGGMLASLVSHHFQHDKDIKIKKQVLIYPGLDMTMSLDSWEENGFDYLLTKQKVIWYYNNYFNKNDNRKEASALFSDISGYIPETFVISCQYCPLRDEAYAYVDKLKKMNVEVSHYNFDNMIHAFMNLEKLAKEECELLYSKINDFLND